jgi:hypothetical protein
MIRAAAGQGDLILVERTISSSAALKYDRAVVMRDGAVEQKPLKRRKAGM